MHELCSQGITEAVNISLKGFTKLCTLQKFLVLHNVMLMEASLCSNNHILG